MIFTSSESADLDAIWRSNARKSLLPGMDAIRICGAVLGAAAVLLSGCVNHDFAPGPGMLVSDFEPESARCRIFARSNQSGFAFGAAGSPRFVATAVGGAAIGAGIAGAVQNNQNYNDCMMARGWRVANRMPTQQVVQAEELPSIAVGSEASTRRRMRVRVNPVSPLEAANQNLRTTGGLMVLEVLPGGVASSAGLNAGDIILAFDGIAIETVDDMQRRLNGAVPNSTVTAVVWRNGQERPVPLQF